MKSTINPVSGRYLEKVGTYHRYSRDIGTFFRRYVDELDGDKYLHPGRYSALVVDSGVVTAIVCGQREGNGRAANGNGGRILDAENYPAGPAIIIAVLGKITHGDDDIVKDRCIGRAGTKQDAQHRNNPFHIVPHENATPADTDAGATGYHNSFCAKKDAVNLCFCR